MYYSEKIGKENIAFKIIIPNHVLDESLTKRKVGKLSELRNQNKGVCKKFLESRLTCSKKLFREEIPCWIQLREYSLPWLKQETEVDSNLSKNPYLYVVTFDFMDLKKSLITVLDYKRNSNVSLRRCLNSSSLNNLNLIQQNLTA